MGNQLIQDKDKLVNDAVVNLINLEIDGNDSFTPMNFITTPDTPKLQELHCDCSDQQKCLKTRQKQERNMHYQQEIIFSLKEQLHSLNENIFLSLKQKMEHLSELKPFEPSRNQYFKHFTYYSQKLNDLAKCYADQAFRFLDIQDCLKRCTDVLEIHKDDDKLNSSSIVEETKQTLKDCRKELIQEQSLNISERQNLIKAQHQFQQIFVDYISTLQELEMLRAESSKPSQKDYEMEKKTRNEEKASLNSQCLFYESQLKTSNEKLKDLQADNDCLKSTIDTLKTAMVGETKKFKQIYAELESARKDSELIECLRQQLEIYESDFRDEKTAKEELLREREQLTKQLEKLQRLNDLNSVRIPNQLMNQISSDAFDPESNCYMMPGQWHNPRFHQFGD